MRCRWPATLFLLGARARAKAADSGKKMLRTEVGKPLQAAQTALQAKNYAEAKTDIAAAEAIDKPTPYERYIIERLKASAAIGSGDYTSALAAYGKVMASPELPAEENDWVLDRRDARRVGKAGVRRCTVRRSR